MWTEHFDKKHNLGLEPLSDGKKTTRYHYYTNERKSDDGGYDYDVIEFPSTATPKSAKLAIIDEYDQSINVNSFKYNGVEMWIPKELRISLMNSSTIERAAGKTHTVLWYDGKEFVLPIEALQAMLSAIELYALDCYNVTERHKAEVMALTDIDKINAYDVTDGYPAKLSF